MNSKAKNVVITGVTGQDGSYMADFLLPKNFNVYGVVRRTAKPDLSNLSNALEYGNFSLIEADLSDTASINALVLKTKPDYFINFAAQSFVAASWKMPEHTFDVDALGVIRCLEALHKNAPNCRFYNAGSSEEFGNVVYSPQDEKHPARARSVYGAAKIAARQIVKVYRESYGMYAIQGYLFNHESERRGPEFVTRKITLGLAEIVKNLREGRPIKPIVLGNLDAKRDWSHAEDFVRGIWRMLNQEDYNWEQLRAAGGYIGYNKSSYEWSSVISEYVLSSNETHSIREFIEESFKVAGINITDVNPSRTPPSIGNDKSQQINYVLDDGRPVVVVSREFYRPAEVDLLHGDSSLARKELQWEPSVSFKELVRRMVLNDIEFLTRK